MFCILQWSTCGARSSPWGQILISTRVPYMEKCLFPHVTACNFSTSQTIIWCVHIQSGLNKSFAHVPSQKMTRFSLTIFNIPGTLNTNNTSTTHLDPLIGFMACYVCPLRSPSMHDQWIWTSYVIISTPDVTKFDWTYKNIYTHVQFLIRVLFLLCLGGKFWWVIQVMHFCVFWLCSAIEVLYCI